jgi:hypothetical protein
MREWATGDTMKENNFLEKTKIPKVGERTWPWCYNLQNPTKQTKLAPENKIRRWSQRHRCSCSTDWTISKTCNVSSKKWKRLMLALPHYFYWIHWKNFQHVKNFQHDKENLASSLYIAVCKEDCLNTSLRLAMSCILQLTMEPMVSFEK